MYHRQDEVLRILRDASRSSKVDTKDEMYSEIELSRAIDSCQKNTAAGQSLFNEAMKEDKQHEVTSSGIKTDTPWHYDAGHGMEGSEGNRHITDEDL